MEDIILSEHCIERFVERVKLMCGKEMEDPERTLRNLLMRAVPEEIEPRYRVARLISNNFRDANYFRCEGWRFVIADNTLLTVERIK